MLELGNTPTPALPARGRVISTPWHYAATATKFTFPLAGEARRGASLPALHPAEIH